MTDESTMFSGSTPAVAAPRADRPFFPGLEILEEIAPGVWHWTAFHERIRQDVHSHFLARPRALLDPMLPDEGLDWFEGERRPERILLTNRHHYRHSARFVEAFGFDVDTVADSTAILKAHRAHADAHGGGA